MKGKNKSNTKRYGAVALAIVIALVMILSIVAPVISTIAYGATMPRPAAAIDNELEGQSYESILPEEIDDGQFQISATIGFDNKYIVGEKTPFKFVVTNNGNDFKGELQMKVYLFESDEGQSRQYAIFYVPLELAKNSTKEVEMTAEVTSLRTYFTAKLVDENGKDICVKNFNVIPKDSSSVWTGVLSDSPDELAYIKENDNFYNQQTDYYDGVDYFDTVYLDSKTFPNDSLVLNNFRVLIINDFNTDSLSQEQKNAIAKWVDEGGMLILGTGANAKKVLSGLKDITTFTVSDAVSQVGLKNIGGILAKDLSNLSGLTISDVKMENSTSLLQEDGKIITSSAKVGNGMVILHNFDLGKSPVADVGNMEVLLRTIYEKQNASIFKHSYKEDYKYNPASDMAGRMMPEKGSMMNIIFIIIVGYVIFIGPVLYLVLKKKDKRERGWVIIPISAMAVTIVIYFMGANSYYRNSIINIVSQVDVKNGESSAQAKIYGGLRSGEKGSLKFSADEEFYINTSQMNYRYIYGDGEVCALKINTEKASEATYYGKASWDLNTFATEKSIDMGGALEANIGLSGEKIVGTITNNTNFDFEDIVVNVGSMYTKIDSCMSGETIDIDYKIEPIDLQKGNNGDRYGEIGELFGVEDGYYKFGKDSANYFIKYGRATYLRNIQDTKLSTMNNLNEPICVKVYAFNKQPLITGNKYINGKKMNEMTENIFAMDAELNLENGGEFELPYGVISPSNIVDENGSTVEGDSNYIYKYMSGDIYCEFILPQKINIELFQIKWNRTSEITNPPEILNVTTGEWEKLTEEEVTDLQSYVDSQGKITVRAYSENETEMQVPQIRLKGGNKNA
ncbi:MAG TPA: hypothetical protein DIC60_08915 [Lachnospiraceae bacterium]|nr:hypothetical protein [Lachnospiraceae bacterium]